MIATYQRTIFEKGDFSICSFKPEDESEPPQNAMKYGTFVGVGVNIPHSEDVKLNLDGDWEYKYLHFHSAENRRGNYRFPFIRSFAIHQKQNGDKAL